MVKVVVVYNAHTASFREAVATHNFACATIFGKDVVHLLHQTFLQKVATAPNDVKFFEMWFVKQLLALHLFEHGRYHRPKCDVVFFEVRVDDFAIKTGNKHHRVAQQKWCVDACAKAIGVEHRQGHKGVAIYGFSRVVHLFDTFRRAVQGIVC